jgi:hypothetical protein
MTKVKPNTKEQLIYFLLSNLNLGTYDSKFLTNIQTNNVISKKPLTTNQAALLYKIVERYAKQLRKLELNVLELIDLPWTLEPIPSIPEYTEAHLILEESNLILRSPYQREFVKAIAKSEINAKWYKDTKQWIAPANTYTLKMMKLLLVNNYNEVNYCDKITQLLNKVELHKDCKYWNPTYVYVNGSYYVMASTQEVIDAIEHIPFTEELSTIAQLTRYGIEIDESVKEQLYKKYSKDDVAFALEFKVAAELDDVTIVDKLRYLKTDLILISKVNATTQEHIQYIKNAVAPKISWAMISDVDTSWYDLLKQSKYPVIITSGMWIHSMSIMRSVGKVIHIVNSKPIDIK